MKKTLLGKLGDSAQSTGICLPNQTLLEVLGRNRVLIENHKGIIAYDDGCIWINSSHGAMEITGQKLNMKVLTRCKAVICGTVDRISFLEGEG